MSGFEFCRVGAVAEEQLGATEDSGQCVVDVVGDAKRELAKCSHLLRVNLLFAFSFVLLVRIGNDVETFT